jgi:uncharacterized oxidoreductase
MNLSGNIVLITGGGSGIGRALAHRFHDLGNTVIVAGRRRQALEAAAAGRANIISMPLDIDSANAVDQFADELLRRHQGLNVLINNAGIMRFEDLSGARNLADAEATITTNLLGPIRMTNALIDHLIGRPDGVIMNVTSGLAFVPLTAAPVYSATKAAIHSYTVSLREILRGKVEVVELAPPGVQTDLTPGQATRPGYQPLEAFADEAMALLGRSPTPEEVLVERVQGLRRAEIEGRFDQTVTALNEMARQARLAQNA